VSHVEYYSSKLIYSTYKYGRYFICYNSVVVTPLLFDISLEYLFVFSVFISVSAVTFLIVLSAV
jgi:hypothetical protein